MNQIFEALAKAGIDGTDPEKINAFLEKIKASSPELYQFFSENTLTGFIKADLEEKIKAIKMSEVKIDLTKEKESEILHTVFCFYFNNKLISEFC